MQYLLFLVHHVRVCALTVHELRKPFQSPVCSLGHFQISRPILPLLTPKPELGDIFSTLIKK